LSERTGRILTVNSAVLNAWNPPLIWRRRDNFKVSFPDRETLKNPASTK
jgi:hypothetical protein